MGPGLPEVYKKYTDIFSKELASILPQNSKYDYTIDLEEGQTPPQMPIYNLSQKELQILREYLDSTLDKG